MAQRYSKDQPPGFTNRIEKVAIIGAGGKIGKHIVEQLLKTGKHTLTAILRPTSTSTLPEAIQTIRIDYNDDNNDAALVDALRGQQVLIITMSLAAPPNTVTRLIRAAADAAVPYILPNWFGVDAANDPLCTDTMLAPTRDAIRSQFPPLGTSSYLLLICSFWYEYSLGGGPYRYGFDFRSRSLVLYDNGHTPIHTTTWPQCGRAIAHLLSLKELPDHETDTSPSLSQFRNGCVYVSSFRLTQHDMFAAVKRVTHTSDADWTITHEKATQRWKEARDGVLAGNADLFPKMLYSRMFFPKADGHDEDGEPYRSPRGGLDNELLGLPVEDLDECTAVAVRMGEEYSGGN